MGRRVIALVVAGVIAVVGVLSLFVYARAADSRAVAGLDPKPIYVSTKLVPAGTTLDEAVASGALQLTQVPLKALPLGALDKVEDANKALVAVSDINPGEYILASRFGTTKAANQKVAIPSGKVAVSIQLSLPEGVNSFVTPGSSIVVFSTYEIKQASSGPTNNGGGSEFKQSETRILLDEVTVLGVDQSSNTPPPTTAAATAAPASGSSGVMLTVAVTPNEAVRLVQGVRSSQLYVALRGTDVKADTGYVVTNLTTGPAATPLYPAR